jgi:hypothetical protein
MDKVKYIMLFQFIAFGFDVVTMLNPFFDVVDEFGVIIATVIVFSKINKRYNRLRSGMNISK